MGNKTGKIAVGVMAGAAGGTLTVLTGGLAAPAAAVIISSAVVGGAAAAATGAMGISATVPLPEDPSVAPAEPASEPAAEQVSEPAAEPALASAGTVEESPQSDAPLGESAPLPSGGTEMDVPLEAGVASLASARALSGMSYSQMDGSHLVHKAFADAGLHYPHTPVVNWPPSQFEKVDEPRAGDVVLFKDHLGIFVDEGRFFGSQTSTGPAEATFGVAQYWGGTKKVLGYYRWKSD